MIKPAPSCSSSTVSVYEDAKNHDAASAVKVQVEDVQTNDKSESLEQSFIQVV